MSMNAEDLKCITLEEFEAMAKDDHLTYELIDGIVMMSPRPNEEHQRYSFNLAGDIRAALKGDSACQGYYELELQIDSHTILIPDIMIICNKNDLTPQRYRGTPLIVIETLSPSTAQRDLLYKLNKYQSIGVFEYWILDPKTKSITVHDFVNSTTAIYISGDTIYSKALEKVVIVVADIFA